MSGKLKAIILLIAIVLGGVFIANMSPNDKSLKRQNNQLKSQIVEMTNLNDALKNQNKVYETEIGNLTTESNSKDTIISDLQKQNEELKKQLDNFDVVEPVTNLKDTVWVFNDTITASAGYGIFDLDFILYYLGNSVYDTDSVESVYIGYSEEYDGEAGEYVFNPVSNCLIIGSSRNISSEYKIEILNSSSDEKLISWLYSNATLQHFNNLKNTTWTFDRYVLFEDDISNITYSINISALNEDGSVFENYDGIEFCRVADEPDDALMIYLIKNGEKEQFASGWSNQLYEKIDFYHGSPSYVVTGGSDIRNKDLINWFKYSATLVK